MTARQGFDATRLDDAARAGWLYYVAGNTQDEIARKLGVSRQSAQRLVSLAVTERLIKVRLDHPIGQCMELSRAMRDRFGLRLCEIVPSDPAAPDLLTGVAIAAAAELERLLKSPEPRIVALGTGRALSACVAQLPAMTCPQHRIVSRLGNMMSDGSASPYNAVVRMSERIGARQYPFPLPVLARDPEELRILQALEPVRATFDLCAKADLTVVGIGQMDQSAPLVVDGFVSRDKMQALMDAGAVGEITSWPYDAEGRLVPGPFHDRVLSAPLHPAPDTGGMVLGVAVGEPKVPAMLAALRGRLINGLVTNEATAERVLSLG
ncbi:sugar-binding transcriptional regulator [Mesobaculum littorinae]|uniref:Sugar-binding transcriptional regulator n=1 Tax=Mesobaculum littorinae TaxID=2486419 RepID=A0A438AE53_9RHOB|nr:sugar-binding transcriptional regulator [Mesobaculum littorinae]RVV96993.1 sugar-binding transcriptional regulator [Mesobaculum littorinae]